MKLPKSDLIVFLSEMTYYVPNFGQTSKIPSEICLVILTCGGHVSHNRCRICGSFYLSLSRRQLFKWNYHYLSENIAIFYSNSDVFTQYLFLNEKRCHLMTFTWCLESERMRVRGKRNHKFRASLSKYWIFSKLVYLRSFL